MNEEAGEADGIVTAMAIFKCIDDPTTGPRLRTLGITDDDLVKYIVDRANELASDDVID